MNYCNIIDKDLAKALMPKRSANSNKGTFGTILNFSGCKEYIGAAYLSSKSPLRTGAGLVELATPNYVKDKVASLCPDIIFAETNTYSYLDTIPKHLNFSKYSSLIIGCGLGNNKYTKKFIKEFTQAVKNIKAPIIYDADALNIIAEENITQLGTNAIITPHPGEMARLMEKEIGEIQSDREYYAIGAAKKYQAIAVLKGHHTIIATPDEQLFKDTAGTNALSKAGMGDVLTGIIAGLCAQGLNPKQAAVLGVYIHSQAGIYGETKKTPYGLMASDLIEFIPEGIRSIIM